MKYDAVLIDAGTGNLLSVFNALRSLGFSIQVSQNPNDLKSGNRVILPGVGAFGKFMQGLHSFDLLSSIQNIVKRGDPLLGICVGVQAFFEYSEEMGTHDGLNLLAGYVKEFPRNRELIVPHTGWNQIWIKKSCPLLKDLANGDYVYFNHSFFCKAADEEDIVASTDYGEEFTSIVQKNNLYGVQFHPEKSQKIGLQILDNFMRL